MADFTSRLDDAGRSTTEPTLRIGRLPSPVRTSAFKDFFSNVKDFLSERPANIKGAKSDVFKNPEFGEGLGDNFKEFFRSAPRGRVNSDLLVNWNAGFGGFWQNVRDVISPRKMAPLKTTSAPVAVPEIWSKNTQFTRVQALSLAFHVVVIVLIVGTPLRELQARWDHPNPWNHHPSNRQHRSSSNGKAVKRAFNRSNDFIDRKGRVGTDYSQGEGHA